MSKTHLSRWCWTKCSFPINFVVSNSCRLHSPLFSSAHSRSTWANKIKETVVFWLKSGINTFQLSNRIKRCLFRHLDRWFLQWIKRAVKTLSVNLGEQDKRSGFGLIEKWKLKITLQKFNLYCNEKVKNIYGHPGQTR